MKTILLISFLVALCLAGGSRQPTMNIQRYNSGNNYGYSISCEGGQSPWNYQVSGLPSGSYFRDNRIMIPPQTRQGNHRISISARDAAGAFIQRQYDLYVANSAAIAAANAANAANAASGVVVALTGIDGLGALIGEPGSWLPSSSSSSSTSTSASSTSSVPYGSTNQGNVYPDPNGNANYFIPSTPSSSSSSSSTTQRVVDTGRQPIYVNPTSFSTGNQYKDTFTVNAPPSSSYPQINYSVQKQPDFNTNLQSSTTGYQTLPVQIQTQPTQPATVQAIQSGQSNTFIPTYNVPSTSTSTSSGGIQPVQPIYNPSGPTPVQPIYNPSGPTPVQPIYIPSVPTTPMVRIVPDDTKLKAAN